MFLSKTFGIKGIRPDDKKFPINKKNIESADIPNVAYIPVCQHYGTPAKIIVKPGDVVEEGQLIAVADGEISANVHASIPGVVRGIEEVYIGNGKKSDAVVIELGGSFSKSGRIIQLNDWLSMTKEELLEKITESGIIGHGGRSFPEGKKLEYALKNGTSTLIINGAESEPYLTSDHRLLLEKTEGILIGTQIVNKILEAKNVYIAVENNKRDAIRRLRILSANRYTYKTVGLKVKYPQGNEHQLVKAVTGKVIAGNESVQEHGITVINVATLIAIKNAVINDKPMIERVVTVSGSGVLRPKNLIVRIGTPIGDVIEECGGFTGRIAKVVIGGPMRGYAQKDLKTPVTKDVSGILCITHEESSHFKKNGICINCGKCVNACAQNLMPSLLVKYISYKHYDLAFDSGLESCKECGACAWVCPAKIPLVQQIQFGKNICQNRKKVSEEKSET
jgi:electron transport complex protein RnfC